jgi:hypothetical protein
MLGLGQSSSADAVGLQFSLGQHGRTFAIVLESDLCGLVRHHHVDQRLRAPAARYPDDPEIVELIREILAGSAEFAQLWASHDVGVAAGHALRKAFQNAMVGPVTVNCDVLDITERDQQVVIYTAVPGSRSEEALRLLSVIGTQRMDVAR